MATHIHGIAPPARPHLPAPSLPASDLLQPLSVEAGLLTPSFKLKRGPLLEHYKAQVEEMYAQLKAGGRS